MNIIDIRQVKSSYAVWTHSITSLMCFGYNIMKWVSRHIISVNSALQYNKCSFLYLRRKTIDLSLQWYLSPWNLIICTMFCLSWKFSFLITFLGKQLSIGFSKPNEGNEWLLSTQTCLTILITFVFSQESFFLISKNIRRRYF